MPPVDPGPRALPHAGLAHAALARRGGPRSETERPARAGLAEHGFLLTALFAFFEYGRPQDFFGVIDVLHPNLVLSVALVGCLLSASQRVQRVASKTVLLTLLVGYLIAWVPFAVNNFWAFQIARLTLLLLIFFVAFVTFVDTSEKLERFIGVWLAALALQAVWGLTHAGMGTGGFLGDENDLALALNVGFPFALYGVLRSRGSRRLFFLACVGLLLAGVVASKSRGGFVGLVATAGMILLVSRRRLAILALVAVGAGLLALLAPRSYWTEIETIFDTQNETRVERVAMWEAAERAFRDNPVFGVGPGNVNWRLVEYEVPDPSRPSFAGRAIHSLYWTLLPELGLVGVALYGALFAVTGREILRIRKRSGRGSPSALDFQARAILCALIAYLVCGVFLSVLYYPHLTYLMAMSTAADRIGARGSRS